MAVPETVEEAAFLAADVKEIVYGERVLAEAGLNSFDSRMAHNQQEIRRLQAEMDQMISTELENTRNSVQAFAQANEQLQELHQYYTNALGELSNHLPNVDGYIKAKDDSETLAAAVENLEGDFNQASNVMDLEKQVYMSSRLNYEERVREAIERTKEVFKTGADNTLLVYREVEKLANLAESLAT